MHAILIKIRCDSCHPLSLATVPARFDGCYGIPITSTHHHPSPPIHPSTHPPNTDVWNLARLLSSVRASCLDGRMVPLAGPASVSGGGKYICIHGGTEWNEGRRLHGQEREGEEKQAPKTDFFRVVGGCCEWKRLVGGLLACLLLEPASDRIHRGRMANDPPSSSPSGSINTLCSHSSPSSRARACGNVYFSPFHVLPSVHLHSADGVCSHGRPDWPVG